MRTYWQIGILVLIVVSFAWLDSSRAEETTDDAFADFASEVDFEGGSDQFVDYDIRALGEISATKPADSRQNPGNLFVRFPSSLYSLFLRPNFSKKIGAFSLMFKPRGQIQYGTISTLGANSGSATNTESEFFLQEAMVEAQLTDGLFLGLERKSLQWGPAYLVSPSNPFFPDNGRTQPRLEIRGMDFARSTWVINERFSLSGLWNFREGAFPLATVQPFHQRIALKADYFSEANYASLILSKAVADRAELGWFAGQTISDALIVYGEGNLRQGSPGLYPVPVDLAESAFRLERRASADNSLIGSALVGGTYTFSSGWNLATEYFYNGFGYNEADASNFQRVLVENGSVITAKGIVTERVRNNVSDSFNLGIRRLRRHYLLFQIVKRDIEGVLGVTTRWTYNLEDSSSQLIQIFDYNVSDSLQSYFSGQFNLGRSDGEFRAIIQNSIAFGFEYYF